MKLSDILVSALLFSFIILINCSQDNNPLSPESLSGAYTLVSYTDKKTKILYQSGVPTENEEGTITSFTGQLILTETEFELSRTITFFHDNRKPQAVSEKITGNYYVSQNRLVVVDDKTGKYDSIPMEVVKKHLILEDFEFKFIYTRK